MRVLVYGLNAEMEAVRASLRGRFTDEDRVSYREASAWKANEIERADLILVAGDHVHAERVLEGTQEAGLRAERVATFLKAAAAPAVEVDEPDFAPEASRPRARRARSATA